jgi:hypothetical protein
MNQNRSIQPAAITIHEMRRLGARRLFLPMGVPARPEESGLSEEAPHIGLSGNVSPEVLAQW